MIAQVSTNYGLYFEVTVQSCGFITPTEEVVFFSHVHSFFCWLDGQEDNTRTPQIDCHGTLMEDGSRPRVPPATLG